MKHKTISQQFKEVDTCENCSNGFVIKSVAQYETGFCDKCLKDFSEFEKRIYNI